MPHKNIIRWFLFCTLGAVGIVVGFLWAYVSNGYRTGRETFFAFELGKEEKQ